MHGAVGAVKLEECQYKGTNTFVGAQQKWEVKDVSVVLSLLFCVLNLTGLLDLFIFLFPSQLITRLKLKFHPF